LFGRTAKQIAQGDSPAAAVGKGVLGKVTDGIKGALGGGSGGRAVTIVEDIDVGVPVRVAYNRWTQLAEFPSDEDEDDAAEADSGPPRGRRSASRRR